MPGRVYMPFEELRGTKVGTFVHERSAGLVTCRVDFVDRREGCDYGTVTDTSSMRMVVRSELPFFLLL
jgi:hypothetical protein